MSHSIQATTESVQSRFSELAQFNICCRGRSFKNFDASRFKKYRLQIHLTMRYYQRSIVFLKKTTILLFSPFLFLVTALLFKHLISFFWKLYAEP
jgi:hypothetical protein